MNNGMDKTLEYHELIMVNDNIVDHLNYELPQSYHFSRFTYPDNLKDWVNIHLSTGEFTSVEESENFFKLFYGKILDKIGNYCIFIENENNEKVATATLNLDDAYGYKVVIDWVAITPKFQGKHLAKPLISRILNIAHNMGYNKILLHTQTHSYVAVNMYLGLGFKPYNTEDKRGWSIVQTIINNPLLNNFDVLPNNQLYHSESVNIVKQLNKLYRHYNYEIWFKDGRKDVYVNDGNNYYEYTYSDGGKILNLVNKNNYRAHY